MQQTNWGFEAEQDDAFVDCGGGFCVNPERANDPEVSLTPRQEAFKRLPRNRVFQAFLTFVSGVPAEGQSPLWKNTPLSVVATSHGMLATSVTVGALATVGAAISGGVTGALFLAVAFVAGMISTGRLRASHHMILHHASHGDFGKLSNFIGESASLMAFTMPLSEYRPKHIYHHGHTADKDDPELQLVHRLGFVPGKSVKWYWRQLRRVLVSPRYIGTNLHNRWNSNFGPQVPSRRKALAALVQGGILAGAVAASVVQASILPFIVYLMAWALPLTFGWHVSQTLYVMGLHLWELEQEERITKRQFYVQKTGARFFADPLPAQGQGLVATALAWARWGLRFAFLHLLVSRLFCVSGDNSGHDVHHIALAKLDWPNVAYDRPRLLKDAQGKDDYWNTWGLFDAINVTFETLAAIPPKDGWPEEPVNLEDVWRDTELI